MATNYGYIGSDGRVTNKSATCTKNSDTQFTLKCTANVRHPGRSSGNYFEWWGFTIGMLFNNCSFNPGVVYDSSTGSGKWIFTSKSNLRWVNGSPRGRNNIPLDSCGVKGTGTGTIGGYLTLYDSNDDTFRVNIDCTSNNMPSASDTSSSTITLSVTYVIDVTGVALTSITGLYMFGLRYHYYNSSGNDKYFDIFNDYTNIYSAFDNAVNPKDSGNVLKRTGNSRNNIAWRNGNILSGDKVLQRTGTGRNNIRWLTISKGTTFNILERTGSGRNNIAYKSHWA